MKPNTSKTGARCCPQSTKLQRVTPFVQQVAENIQSEIEIAIKRSISHTEIVRVEAENKDEAKAMIAAAVSIADDTDLEFDSTDTNEGYEVWAGPEGSEKMEWRLRIVIAAEELRRLVERS